MLLNYEIWNTFNEMLNEILAKIFHFSFKIKYTWKFIDKLNIAYKFLK